jgi:hypothetical protein
MTQQMGELVATSRQIVALLRPYTLALICFQAVLMLLQHNRKYKVVYILVFFCLF